MPTTVRKQGTTVIFTLEGRLALGEEVDNFRTQWTDALASGSRDVIVNLGGVSMVDSSGIGSLIRCHSAVTGSGGEMKLVGASDMVKHVFKITRLDRVFDFFETEEGALEAAKSKAAGA